MIEPVLEKGEKKIFDVKPDWKIIFLFLFRNSGRHPSLASILVLALILLLAFSIVTTTGEATIIEEENTLRMSTLIYWVIGLLLIRTFFAILQYQKEHYWVTNKRVIGRKGVIGYVLRSVPLGKISDITITRTFIQQIFSVPGLRIQSFAGGTKPELEMIGVSHPEHVQSKILQTAKSHKRG